MPIRHYILHLRPRSWPIVFLHFAAGAALAAGLGLADSIPAFLVGGGLWAICLNGGTLALNTAFDRDEGDIGYLDAPPPIPPGLAGFSLALMGAGLLGAAWVSRGFLAAYATCMALSLLYSAPPTRLKARSGWDVVINGAGYGFLTPLAGAMIHGAPTPAVAALCLSFGFLFACFYPMTQIYQMDEDAGRGDKTLAIALGVRGSLDFAALMFLIALGVWIAVGFLQPSRAWPMAWVAAAAAGWVAILAPWRLGVETYPAQQGMYRALKVWALTDLCIVLAFAPRP